MKVALGLLLILILSGLVLHRVLPRLWRRELNPLNQRRLERFRKIRYGYFAFVLITSAFFASFFLELYVNNKPLYIRYQDRVQYPAVANWANTVVPFGYFPDQVLAADFGLEQPGELDARDYAAWVKDPAALEQAARAIEEGIAADEERFRSLLQEQAAAQDLVYDPTEPLPESKLEDYENKREQAARYRALQAELEQGAASIMMPLYPHSPREQLLSLPGSPPHAPFQQGMPLLGTDASGKDVLAQLLYGFRLSLLFGLGVALAGYLIGVTVGGLMGYYGGWIDIGMQRFIEVWASIPFLYTIIIIAAIVQPGFWLLVGILVLLKAWVGITYTMRGEFYRERSRDYVQAAHALGARDRTVMFRHILPNALVPIITFLPFDIVAFMETLVALDFLGFGLPPGTPSWGALLRQGAENIVNHPHLVWIPVVAFAATLFTVVLVGEAAREAFDPRRYSRLR